MKYFTAFSLLILFIIPAFAEEMYLRDVPEGHYAYSAVYDLINRGITGGFPDGTFRGKRFMNRFEIAAFLSKFAKSTNLDRGVSEKLVEELKSEVSLIRYQREKDSGETQIAGDIQTRRREGRTEKLDGARVDYRLRARLIKNFGETASLKMDLDTMDEGFSGGQRDLVREMLDLEGKAKIGAVTLKVTSGPGDIVHRDDGLFPGENEVRYRRPRRTFAFLTSAGRTDFSLEYIARSTLASGQIDVAEISSKLSLDFSPLKFIFNPRVFYNESGARDFRLELTAKFIPTKNLNSLLLIGAAKGEEFPHGLYARGELALGEGVKIVAQKIGTQYREKFSYGIFDIFDRNLPDGSSDVGLELIKKLGKAWFIRVKGNFTKPEEIITSEYRLGYSFEENSAIALTYQTYQTETFSEALGIEAIYKF